MNEFIQYTIQINNIYFQGFDSAPGVEVLVDDDSLVLVDGGRNDLEDDAVLVLSVSLVHAKSKRTL